MARGQVSVGVDIFRNALLLLFILVRGSVVQAIGLAIVDRVAVLRFVVDSPIGIGETSGDWARGAWQLLAVLVQIGKPVEKFHIDKDTLSI